MAGFPKIGVFPPKWMVKMMENPTKMDDLGGTLIFGKTRMDVFEVKGKYKFEYKLSRRESCKNELHFLVA